MIRFTNGRTLTVGGVNSRKPEPTPFSDNAKMVSTPNRNRPSTDSAAGLFHPIEPFLNGFGGDNVRAGENSGARG